MGVELELGRGQKANGKTTACKRCGIRFATQCGYAYWHNTAMTHFCTPCLVAEMPKNITYREDGKTPFELHYETIEIHLETRNDICSKCPSRAKCLTAETI